MGKGNNPYFIDNKGCAKFLHQMVGQKKFHNVFNIFHAKHTQDNAQPYTKTVTEPITTEMQ